MKLRLKNASFDIITRGELLKKEMDSFLDDFRNMKKKDMDSNWSDNYKFLMDFYSDSVVPLYKMLNDISRW